MSFDKRNWPEILVRVARYGLAAVFLTSALAKLFSPSKFGVLVLFSSLLLFGFAGDTDVGCGCFGEIIPDSTTETAIVRNVFLMFLSAFVAKSAPPQIQMI